MNSDPNILQRRFGLALIASMLVHLLLVVFVDMVESEQPKPPKKEQQIMDVVLLDDKKTKQKDKKNDSKFLANQSIKGGSTAQANITQQAQMPTTAPQRQPKPTPPSQPKTPSLPQQQQSSRMLAKRGESPDRKATKKQQLPDKSKQLDTPTPKLKMQNLLPSTMEMAQMSQRYQRELRMQQNMQRSAEIPINTRDSKYASYVQRMIRTLEDQWRPDLNIDFGKYTDNERIARLKITIDKNGNLVNVEIIQPSAVPEINNSAVAAVHAAAPFRVLPSSWGLEYATFPIYFGVYEDRFVFRPM